jgi:phage terminase large subunit-like protein
VGVFKDELTKARDIRDGKRDRRDASGALRVLRRGPAGARKGVEKPGKLATSDAERGEIDPYPAIDRGIQDAQDTSDEELRAWASQHLNIEIGLRMQADGWAGAQFWEARAIER